MRLTVAERARRAERQRPVNRKIHRLKTWSFPFDAVKRGAKPFEIRKADRGYDVGDFLVLDEWVPSSARFTNHPPLVRVVTYMMAGGQFGVDKDHVVMAIDKLADAGTERLILELAPPRADEPLPTPSEEPKP